jgi:hypothetical protein
MLKKIAIGFGLLVLIAVSVIYGKFFITRAVKDRAAVENVNAQYAIADIEGDQIFQARISSLQEQGIIGEECPSCSATHRTDFPDAWSFHARPVHVA